MTFVSAAGVANGYGCGMERKISEAMQDALECGVYLENKSVAHGHRFIFRYKKAKL